MNTYLAQSIETVVRGKELTGDQDRVLKDRQLANRFMDCAIKTNLGRLAVSVFPARDADLLWEQLGIPRAVQAGDRFPPLGLLISEFDEVAIPPRRMLKLVDAQGDVRKAEGTFMKWIADTSHGAVESGLLIIDRQLIGHPVKPGSEEYSDLEIIANACLPDNLVTSDVV